eukprot:TRINITY_DN8651_c0_g1_i2.p1 TRINITY_DN8651_c0_g1~~TRINITY_DN8651_c0_g1_i2.p1  ORF type:complete len:108 (+),score=26.28 TRINITY_DN8651_c0_g1_i2:89-412(+)
MCIRDSERTMDKILNALRGSGGGDAGGKVFGGIASLAAAAGLAYAGSEAMYTVEGGHRVVIYDRFSGVDNQVKDCLLYTSDAADEEDSVDLGGRRIIKKKKRRKNDR